MEDELPPARQSLLGNPRPLVSADVTFADSGLTWGIERTLTAFTGYRKAPQPNQPGFALPQTTSHRSAYRSYGQLNCPDFRISSGRLWRQHQQRHGENGWDVGANRCQIASIRSAMRGRGRPAPTAPAGAVVGGGTPVRPMAASRCELASVLEGVRFVGATRGASSRTWGRCVRSLVS